MKRKTNLLIGLSILIGSALACSLPGLAAETSSPAPTQVEIAPTQVPPTAPVEPTPDGTSRWSPATRS